MSWRANGAHHRLGRVGVGDHRVDSDVGQNVANAARSHFVWSTMPTISRAAATIERLIWASSSVASAEAGLQREPRRAEERRLDVDPAEQPFAEGADQRQRLPADAPAGHQRR